MIKHQLFIAVALLAGVAIGYFVKDEPVAAEQPTKVEEKAKRKIANKGDEASVRALRRRIAELEKALAEREGKSEIAISNAVAEAAKARPPEPPRRNWRERMEEMKKRMEELKKNNPEEYARRTNLWAQVRRSRAEQARNKIDFLSSMDTSRMSAGAKKTHAALQELIAKREEIEAQLQDPDLSFADRGELMRQFWESNGELQRLNGEERRNLLDETAKQLGFEGEDAKEISATIQEVIRATDSGWGGGRRGGHHGGGHHGGGPRGPGGPGGR